MNGEDYILPDYCTKRILILGCGNRLFGDDGFGPAVIDYLWNHYEIPDDVYVMDVGTGVRKLLFTLALSEQLPEQILIIDAVDKGRTPGELFEISLNEVPLQKADDFSLHQAPTSNLAKELKDRGVTVRVLACQTDRVGPLISVGLSEPLSYAVGVLGDRIAQEFSFPAKSPVVTPAT
jgi:coenzyme F420 hydrogenase subunit delta